MFRGDRDKDTICAISTPHGVGGISVVRVSGPQSLFIVSKLCSFIPQQPVSHRAFHGLLKSADGKEEIDEVVVTYFKQGRSFTGEEVLEISCHGSPVICQNILNELVDLKVRPADRGEFSYRAFMSGRIDLIQAESILSLIESQSQQAARLALRQLKGAVSKKLEKVEDDMTWILAHAEAGIDFSTEDLEVIDYSEVLRRLESLDGALSELISSFKSGRVLKDGLRVVLTGLPNVGKSSLLNTFLEEDRAIVTEIPGTTRDVIDGDTTFKGVKFTFSDTAGLRENVSDLVEKIGVERSRQATGDSDEVFFVFDLENGLSASEIAILDSLDPSKTFIVGNKLDRIPSGPDAEVFFQTLKTSKFFSKIQDPVAFAKRRLFFVSALDRNIRALVLDGLVQEYVDLQKQNDVLISNSRHWENLSKALQNTRRTKEVVRQGLGHEFVAFELKDALISIQETLGKRFDDQIMDRVFKEFCIGK
jgi:tRNA modification GTPase